MNEREKRHHWCTNIRLHCFLAFYHLIRAQINQKISLVDPSVVRGRGWSGLGGPTPFLQSPLRDLESLCRFRVTCRHRRPRPRLKLRLWLRRQRARLQCGEHSCWKRSHQRAHPSPGRRGRNMSDCKCTKTLSLSGRFPYLTSQFTSSYFFFCLRPPATLVYKPLLSITICQKVKT